MMNNKMKIALFLAATMMVGSANAFAASTSATQMKPIAAASTKSENKTASIDDQIDKLTKGLKSGQMIAYYVSDKEYNRLDKIFFTGKGFVLNKYNDYLAKAKEMKAPSLTKPTALPKGYKLKEGILYLKSPDETSALYKELEKELKAEAAEGGQSVYSKSVKVSESFSTILNYEKGKVKVSVVATYLNPSQPIGGRPVPSTKPNQKTETIQINGVECIYTTDSKGTDHLDWVDEEKQVRYTIWAESAKSDVLSFAKKMLAD
ncbi:hypothetical protein MNQ98_16685 [Paenibacillus sp. N3/727]|uniref:hypothetical protein n=1 Tax=Paenibacillus sp. N3/727 TaxID=2925845 RepID=UPI001F537B4A|nr:hypothetical protein [Paenibacillus sp. N3/727]UNK16168.1 hypothetical protein MNQ98_16685 [Paenibacillus sp. N3/727]